MTETFDPSKKASNITLSNANLTANNNLATPGGSGWDMVLSLTGRSTGKYSFGLKMTGLSGADNWAFMGGISTDPGSGNYAQYPGAAGNSVGLEGPGTFHRTGMSAGVSQSTILSSLNDYQLWEVDLDAGKIWVKKNGGSYDNSGNPATGANASTTFTSPLTLFPVGCLYQDNVNNKLTLMASAADLSGLLSSGYTAWEGAAVAPPLIPRRSRVLFRR